MFRVVRLRGRWLLWLGFLMLASALGLSVLSIGPAVLDWLVTPVGVTEPEQLPQPQLRPGESPPADQFFLEPGFRLELVVGQLTYPTMVTFDDKGSRVFVCEAGYSYGPATAIPRVLEVLSSGKTRELARLPDGPITSIQYRDGYVYAIGGRAPASIWRIKVSTGEIKTVLTGLHVWGHHFTSQLVFGPDDKMYFGVGSPSNSGVIGLDDFYTYGYISIFPAAHDLPAVDHKLVGLSFATEDPFTDDPGDKAVTGAFHPFGIPAVPNEIVLAGSPPEVTGVIMRCNVDGSGLEVFASGFRNPYGLGFSPDGRLLAVEQGMDNSGSRPVANDYDSLWAVECGGWYGYPDYASGIPVTDPQFAPADGPAPQLLLAEHPPLAPGPLYRFAHSTASHHFSFSSSKAFGFVGQMFIAQYGSQFAWPPAGHRVVRFDLQTRQVQDFYINLIPGPGGTAPERPTAAQFSPDGSLYVVDFGELATDTKVFFPSALTGALWRIVPKRLLMTEPRQPTAMFGMAIGALLLILTATGLYRLEVRRAVRPSR